MFVHGSSVSFCLRTYKKLVLCFMTKIYRKDPWICCIIAVQTFSLYFNSVVFGYYSRPIESRLLNERLNFGKWPLYSIKLVVKAGCWFIVLAAELIMKIRLLLWRHWGGLTAYLEEVSQSNCLFQFCRMQKKLKRYTETHYKVQGESTGCALSLRVI